MNKGYNIGINNPKHKKHRKNLPLIKHFTKCIDCGKELSKGSKLGRCRSCSKKGQNHPMFGQVGYWNGKKNPEQSKRHSGKNHPNYIDGRSFEKYPKEFDIKLKDRIRCRDNHTCQHCGITQEESIIINGRDLDVHHIDYNRNNCNENNLITTCLQCNVRANYNRFYWQEYYTKKIEDIYANL